MDQNKIRNFCIIAHIDHGKSTLADRMLEVTGTVAKRDMQEQLLDQMDIERERGITIKLAPVRMLWKENIFNLIDTPGHVDFAYEVSRSLAAVEGAVLLVDATQGIEAQTLSNLYQAIDHNLEIIPVVNKIDLPAAKTEEVSQEIIKILGCKKEDILFTSGKTGEGVAELLDRIVEVIPSPIYNSNLKSQNDNLKFKISEQWQGDNELLRALIFDSIYDPYRGVVAYVRIFSGKIEKNSKIFLMQSKSRGEVIETGYFLPKLSPHSPLVAGEIGYVVTGFREVSEARVGDTITDEKKPADSPLPGYKTIQPLVFASIFCVDGGDYPELKEAIAKLKLNDASLSFELEQSPALGFGFRCGFLGLLHLEIIKERLEREYNLSLVVSSPSVKYIIINNDGSEYEVEKPSDMPERSHYREAKEPWTSLEIFSPKEYLGKLMEVVSKKRAQYQNTEFLDEFRAIIKYDIPLSEVIIDLYDQLKSASSGYASMSYEVKDYREAELEKVDILIAEEKMDALSFVLHKLKAQTEARRIVDKLKELIPRQNYEVKIQAAIGASSAGLGTGKIIAASRIPPFRKDVIAKLYGGDVTRKNKLLEKQRKGKKKMKSIGRIEVPTDVFVKVLRSE